MSESKVCFRWRHGQKITANDLVLALNEAYGLGMDTDNIFSCYQYKVIFSNRTVYCLSASRVKFACLVLVVFVGELLMTFGNHGERG